MKSYAHAQLSRNRFVSPHNGGVSVGVKSMEGIMNYKGTREAFAMALYQLLKEDEKYHFISADSVKASRVTAIEKDIPESFTEAGISEQCALAMAAGMASSGLVPFVATYAGFITMRACEQLRTFIAYPKLNVKLIGLNGGVIGGEKEGVTHQFYEDIAIVRAIPGVDIICPSDPDQVYQATLFMAKTNRPTYMRIGSGREEFIPDLTDKPYEYGKVKILKKYGHDAIIFCQGFLLPEALKAVEALKNEGIETTLVEVATICPIDQKVIEDLLPDFRVAVSLEDHNIIGGLGSAIAEISSASVPIRLTRLGLQDTFAESGTPKELVHAYGMDADNVVKAVKDILL